MAGRQFDRLVICEIHAHDVCGAYANRDEFGLETGLCGILRAQFLRSEGPTCKGLMKAWDRLLQGLGKVLKEAPRDLRWGLQGGGHAPALTAGGRPGCSYVGAVPARIVGGFVPTCIPRGERERTQDMNTLRNRFLVALVLLGLVAFAFPAYVEAGGYIGSLSKTGASGQQYQWASGGC